MKERSARTTEPGRPDSGLGRRPQDRATAGNERLRGSISMAQLGFVTSCMGRLDDLRRSLESRVCQPGCPCVVVDYSCPERAGDWVEANFPQVTVVRRVGMTEFNRSAARNAGAEASDASWICFVDADVRLDPGFAEVMLPRLAEGYFYRPESAEVGVEATCICSLADFRKVGGYDEVYRGWGEEDNDLYDALRFAGVVQARFPGSLLHHFPHDDDRRTQFSPFPDRLVNHAINRVYRILKWDTAGMWRRPLPPADRSRLYEEALKFVTRCRDRGEADDLQIDLIPLPVPGGWSLSRRLSYRLARDAAAANAASPPPGDG